VTEKRGITPVQQRYRRKGEYHPVWIAWVLDDCIEAYGRMNRMMIGYARNELVSRDEAADLVAGVWMDLVSDIISRKIDEWSDAMPWRRLKLRLIDEYRKPKVFEYDDNRPEEEASCETDVLVSVMVQRLPDNERRVVEDRMAGYTVDEVAERTGTDKSTVKRRWKTAVERMRG
jgi:RNA polymerase sigma factor (sigma-70 family)